MRKQIEYFLVIFFILSIFHNLNAKEDWPVLKGPYLGQKPPGKTPEIFAPGIVSTGTDGGEFNSVFSPDGNEFYYSLTNKEKKRDQIMYMRRVNNIWTKPEIAPFSGKYDDCDMFISYDGYRFFFISIGRKLPGDDGDRYFISPPIIFPPAFTIFSQKFHLRFTLLSPPIGIISP